MHIVCPNCSTSYAINPDSFGSAGRSVRCARCKEVWHARPQALARAVSVAAASASAAPPADDLSGWGLAAEDEASAIESTPMVESPPLSSALPDGDPDPRFSTDMVAATEPSRGFIQSSSRLGQLLARVPLDRLPLGRVSTFMAKRGLRPKTFKVSLTGACTVLATLTMGLIFWRTEIVRHLPQTADFYQLVGLNVNLRSLAFKDVRVGRETVDGKPVLVIEGVIVAEGRKAVDLPRLRFIVRDDKGAEVYAWNLLLDQSSVRPSEPAWFRSRLAAPPAEGRSVDVRFFNSRDAGSRG